MRKWLFYPIIFIMLLFFVSCSRGETISFVYFIDEVPQSLDPQLATTNTQINIITNLYSGLFKNNLQNEIEPYIVKDYSVNENELEYTFNLKDDFKYNYAYDSTKDEFVTPSKNNEALVVTAYDFEFAFKRIFDKNTNSPYAKEFSNILNAKKVLNETISSDALGVKAIDEFTLRITLEIPDDDFISKLTLAGAMPCNEKFFNMSKGTYGLVGKKNVSEKILSNGTFYLSVWNEQDGVTLRKQEFDETDINRIRFVTEKGFYIAPNATKEEKENFEFPTQLERLKSMQTNAEILNSEFLHEFDGEVFSNKTWAISFNNKDKYFSNKDIRNGISYSTRFMQKYDYDMNFSKPLGIIPSDITIGKEKFRNIAVSLQEPSSNGAEIYKQGLETLYNEGKINKNKVLSNVKILVPDSEYFIKLGQEITQKWQKELSLFVSIETLPINELKKRVESGNYQLAFYPFTASQNDIVSLVSIFSSENEFNFLNYTNEQYDDIMNNISTDINDEQLISFLCSAEELLLQDFACVPIVNENSFIAINGVKDIVIQPFGPIFDLTWAKVNDKG